MVELSMIIMKGKFNFVVKAWLTLVHLRLSPTNGENMLSSARTFLVKGIMEAYEIYVANIIYREIQNQEVSTNTTLTFHI